MSEVPCAEAIKRNTGLSRCKLPKALKGVIELPHGTEITIANFSLLATWNTLLLNPYGTRAYLYPWFKMLEEQSEAAVRELTHLASMSVRKGQYRWRPFLKESLCLHKAMFTHDSEGGEVDLILIDVENNFIGTLNDAATHIRGLTAGLIDFENLMLSDGTVSTKSPFFIALEDSAELNKRGVMMQNNFVNQLYRISDVTLTIESISGDDSFVVSVVRSCDGVPIDGLLLADFIVLNAAGADQAPTSAVPLANNPGHYTITKANALVDGTVNLRATADLTVKAYESEGAVALDII